MCRRRGYPLTLDSIPNDSKHSARGDDVKATVHAKDAARDNRIPQMVDGGASRVEEHGDARDVLRRKDNDDGLPPVQANADHGTAQGPVAKRKAPVKEHVVVPSPCSQMLGCRVQILVGPPVIGPPHGKRPTVLVQVRVRSLDPFLEGIPAGESMPERPRLGAHKGATVSDRDHGCRVPVSAVDGREEPKRRRTTSFHPLEAYRRGYPTV